MSSPQTTSDIASSLVDKMMVAVQEIFRTVAPLILENAGNTDHADKQDGSPVTETDREVERQILTFMTTRFPEIPVFGEETGYDNENLPATYWLIDPIDGTASFIKNTATFTSMAVLIHDNQAVACVIYNPSTNDMYTARKGKGAYRNDVLLDLHSLQPVPIALCKGRYIEKLDELLADTHAKHQTGPEGAGYGFAMIADGKAAAVFKLASKGFIHDYATGALLVEEANGAIIPILEDDYTFRTRSFVACHPDLAESVYKHRLDIRALEDPTMTAL
jgi:fructose-1,6-bisphosphatase/inositol monophosphatase family enzyme